MFFGEKYTAVDIGSHSIKLVRFQQKKEKLELLTAGSRELPPAVFKEGIIVEPAIVASRLEELLKELKFRPDKIITAVPGNNLVVRNVELPKMTDKELADAIRWEADEYLPFPAESAAMDYIVLSRGEVIKLLVMAVKEEIVSSILAPFAELGLKPSVVNIQPLALLSILEFQGNLIEPLAVIDMGASSTRVVIGDQNNVFLARNIDTGGNDFTGYIMEEQKFDFQQAEDYKKEHGLRPPVEQEESQLDYDLALDELAVTDPELGFEELSFEEPAGTSPAGDDYLDTMARHLAGEISRSLEFYSGKFRGQAIEQVYLTGGAARLRGLKEIISREINRELKEIEPLSNIGNHMAGDTDLKDFAVAVGLAASEVLGNEGKSA